MTQTDPAQSRDFLNFSDIFSGVVALAEDDPVEHLIVLTFEFDEQQLLNLVQLRALEEPKDLARSGLKLLSAIRPVVFYDARKTKPFGRLPQFLELHPCKTAGFSCHHSKAYCIVTRKTIRLVVGSFNLTYSGLFRNREVLQSWSWDTPASPDSHLLREWITFLEQHYLTEAQASSRSALAAALETLNERTRDWRPEPEANSHFLASGYDGQSGLDLLVEAWEKWYPTQAPASIVAVSPFFDLNPSDDCLATQLGSRFPTLSRLELVTDASTAQNLSRAHYGKHFAPDKSALRLIPEMISSEERERIERQAGASAKDLVLDRTLHAKVLILATPDGAGVAYFGSANFSRKAWLGDNREFGLISRIDDAPALRAAVLRSLSAAPENRFDDLPELPAETPPRPDPEEIVEDALFPGFIEFIVLAHAHGSEYVRFTLHGTDIHRIADYDVHWADQRLTFADGVSQDIPVEQFRNTLLGGRTLEFRHRKSSNRSFWFPFQYDGDIIADRQALMHASSWDWLAAYLDPTAGDDSGDPESLQWLEDRDALPPGAILDVDREANCVIAMQRYLSLFSRVEASFEQRLETVGKIEEPTERLRALRSQIVEPLTALATLLEREPVEQLQDRLFKLGELALLVKSLARQVAVAEDRKAFAEILQKTTAALDAAKGSDPLASRYHTFVVEQLHSLP